jgi:hypothetical protein
MFDVHVLSTACSRVISAVPASSGQKDRRKEGRKERKKERKKERQNTGTSY